MTHVGISRGRNEDACAIEEEVAGVPPRPFDAYIVCDGMGGLGKGDFVSRFTVNAIRQYLLYHKSAQFDIGILEDSLRFAQLATLVATETLGGGEMGSTASVALLVGDTLYMGSVGDSPCLLIRNGEIVVKNDLHGNDRGEVWSYIGMRDGDLLIWSKTIEPISGDILLIGSDGLFNGVPEAHMLRVAQSDWSAESICDRLVRYAVGAQDDNVTLIVARFR
jgi:protein phosphatase